MDAPRSDFRRVCEALIHATQYLGDKQGSEEYTEEDDVRILEHVAFILTEASVAERELLQQVAADLQLDEWAANIGIA